jgi:hypothetical protein
VFEQTQALFEQYRAGLLRKTRPQTTESTWKRRLTRAASPAAAGPPARWADADCFVGQALYHHLHAQLAGFFQQLVPLCAWRQQARPLEGINSLRLDFVPLQQKSSPIALTVSHRIVPACRRPETATAGQFLH